MNAPKSMNKLIIGSVLALLLVACVMLAYSSFDTATSLSDCRQAQESSSASQQLLQSLVMTMGKPLTQDAFMSIIKGDFGTGHIIKKDGNRIEVDDVVFVFADKKLVKVTSLSDAE